MFRCHFTRRGRIVQGQDLDAKTLEGAKSEAHRLLSESILDDKFDGFEVWERANMLFSTHT